jgi:hypothetical protein
MLRAPNLQDVHILQHRFDLADLHHLGDRGHVVLVAGGAQQFQSFDAHALERVGRCARFVRAAAQHACSGAGDAASRLEHLPLVLDRARSGHDDDVAAADRNAARLHDRLLAPERAAGEFVRLADAHRFLNSVKHFEFAWIDAGDIADDAQHGLIGAGGAVNVESALAENRHHVLDVGVRGVFLHDDDHEKSSKELIKRAMTLAAQRAAIHR